MTDTQRKEILRLRQAGSGYVKIAQMLKLSLNTVKSFCQRNPLIDRSPASVLSDDVCPHCGTALSESTGHKPRRFCSDQCRTRFWTEHQAQIARKSVVPSISAACGKRFTDYANRARKYCSHACYISREHSSVLPFHPLKLIPA